MKRILTILGVLALLTVTVTAEVLTVNTTTNGIYLLSTNRASVYSFEITSPYSQAVYLYDSDSLAAPEYGTNYTTSAYTYRTSYATNYVTSYVGQTGYTNWYTNAGIWTLTATNAAATNALTPLIASVVAGNTYVVNTTDALFTRGITLRAATNASIVINYRPAN